MNITDYWRNKLIDWQFRTQVVAKPTQWWWALFTVAPGVTGGGTEVTGGSYARVALAPSDANWYGTHGTTTGNSSGTTGITKNAVTVQFAAPTANWGAINGIALMDASTVGNMAYYGVFSTDPSVTGYAGNAPFNVNAGEGAVVFLPSGLILSFA
jgi:hypothetical protein